jgi:hypothetical protein
VPANILAGAFGFGPKPYFEVFEPDPAREPVRVQFER